MSVPTPLEQISLHRDVAGAGSHAWGLPASLTDLLKGLLSLLKINESNREASDMSSAGAFSAITAPLVFSQSSHFEERY